jgi:hypothetical protein
MSVQALAKLSPWHFGGDPAPGSQQPTGDDYQSWFGLCWQEYQFPHFPSLGWATPENLYRPNQNQNQII